MVLIRGATITPNPVNTGNTVLVTVNVVEINWNLIKVDNTNWSKVASDFNSWNDVKDYSKNID